MTSKEQSQQTIFVQEFEYIMRRLDDATLDKLRDLIWVEMLERNAGDKEHDNL